MSADKAKASSEPAGQVVFLIGASHGGQHGDRRTVDPKAAESLVANGLARYPASRAE